MICPHCGQACSDNAHYCEVDGTPLVAAGIAEAGSALGDGGSAPGGAAPPAGEGAVSAAEAASTASGCRCGAPPGAVDEQGFCTECGRRVVRQPRDHVEIGLAGNFGGVTDRGRRHPRNEDDFTMALETVEGKPVHLLVVCDGVSSSQDGPGASEAACKAALEALQTAMREGRPDLHEAMTDAIKAANLAVCGLPYEQNTDKDAPETTIVAAIVRDGTATVGWVGDSRAYWLAAAAGGQLTRDHSWINDVVDAGKMTLEEASHNPQAHAITRSLGLWEGEVSEEDSAPDVTTFVLPSPCRLLLCSDGFWNYASEPEQIAGLIQQMPADADAQALARRLVEHANRQGGHDNISVAIASFE
jgi:serine/threonine protein phosphatase PrpC